MCTSRATLNDSAQSDSAGGISPRWVVVKTEPLVADRDKGEITGIMVPILIEAQQSQAIDHCILDCGAIRDPDPCTSYLFCGGSRSRKPFVLAGFAGNLVCGMREVPIKQCCDCTMLPFMWCKRDLQSSHACTDVHKQCVCFCDVRKSNVAF